MAGSILSASRLFGLDGRTALVTGASAGLGARFARVLAAHGARVALAARRLDRLAALGEELRAGGAECVAVAMDVRAADTVAAAFERVEADLGPVDLLVNNSGIATTTGVLDLELDDWDAVLETNLRGAFVVAREAARRMVAHDIEGVIVNIASIVAFRVLSGLAPYAASKAGLVQLTRALALELARHRIRVNAIAPGYVATDMNREFFESPPGQALIKRVPQRRLGEVGELDGPLLLLASRASSFMTGSVVTVDGGHSQSSL